MKRTKRDIELENTELRAKVATLEAVVQRLVSQPAVAVPMPCPLPHGPVVVPYVWPTPIGDVYPEVIRGASNLDFKSPPELLTVNTTGCVTHFAVAADGAGRVTS